MISVLPKNRRLIACFFTNNTYGLKLMIVYKQNKYTKWYFDICKRSVNRGQKKKSGHELHHIVPRSLGGRDDENNLALLTYKEHYICHLLLCKMLEGNNRYKMAWALSQLTSKHRITNSRQFEVSRRVLSKCSKGIPKSEEWKKMMRERNLGVNNPNYNPHKHRDTRTPEQKKIDGILKMKEKKKLQAREGLLWFQTEQGQEKLRKSRIGRKQPDTQKIKVSDALSRLYLLQTPTGEQIIVKGIYKAGRRLGFDGANIITHNKSKGFKLLDRDFSEYKYKSN